MREGRLITVSELVTGDIFVFNIRHLDDGNDYYHIATTVTKSFIYADTYKKSDPSYLTTFTLLPYINSTEKVLLINRSDVTLQQDMWAQLEDILHNVGLAY